MHFSLLIIVFCHLNILHNLTGSDPVSSINLDLLLSGNNIVLIIKLYFFGLKK